VINVQTHCHVKHEEQAPEGQAIKQCLEQFMETGNVLHEEGIGRLPVDTDKADRVSEVYQHSLEKSTHAGRDLNIPSSSLQKVLHSSLKLCMHTSDNACTVTR
jgi:hypothetical protein